MRQLPAFIESHWKQINAFLIVALIFLLPRIILIAIYKFSPGSVNADAVNEYWALSTDYLYNGIGAFGDDSYIEPLYPMLIALARNFVLDGRIGVFIAQALIASAGCIYFYSLVKHLSGSKPVAIIAVLFYAFYPYYLRTSVKVSEVPIFRTLLVMTCYHFVRSEKSSWHSCFAGFFSGCMLMFRCMILPGILASIGFQVFRRRFRQAALSAVVFMITALPMAAVFTVKHGTALPTRGGINFYLSNNEFYNRIYPLYHVDLLESYARDLYFKETGNAPGDLKAEDRFFYAKAIEFIRENPEKFIKNRIKNFLLFFDPWLVPRYALGRYSLEPSPDGSLTIRPLAQNQAPLRSLAGEGVHALIRGALLILGFMGMWQRRRELFGRDFVMLLFLINFWFVYSVFWPSTRLYSPVMFVFMFYAAVSLHGLLTVRFAKYMPKPLLQALLKE